MKTYYLKSIVIFALGGILTSAAGNLSGINSSDDMGCPENANPLDTSCAAPNILAFQVWQRMLPRHFDLDVKTGILSFDTVRLSPSDTALVRKAIDTFYDESKIYGVSRNYRTVPFCSDSSLAHSFYIPLSDIDSIKSEYGCRGIQGIRASVGLTNVAFHGANSVSTHLYLAPALDSDTDIDVSHYYDLTMPCPRTCPKKIKVKIDSCNQTATKK